MASFNWVLVTLIIAAAASGTLAAISATGSNYFLALFFFVGSRLLMSYAQSQLIKPSRPRSRTHPIILSNGIPPAAPLETGRHLKIVEVPLKNKRPLEFVEDALKKRRRLKIVAFNNDAEVIVYHDTEPVLALCTLRSSYSTIMDTETNRERSTEAKGSTFAAEEAKGCSEDEFFDVPIQLTQTPRQTEAASDERVVPPHANPNPKPHGDGSSISAIECIICLQAFLIN